MSLNNQLRRSAQQLCCGARARPGPLLARVVRVFPRPSQRTYSSRSAYSYQQVKALVFSQHGEPADVLK
jgi:hypothetical protein